MNRVFLFAAVVEFCLLTFLPGTLRAKLGENLPQLVKRFGGGYTQAPAPAGALYRFRLPKFSVDVLLSAGVSVSETYYSYTPLNKQGDPPQDIVHGVLKTNVPNAKWREIPPDSLAADYALRSDDLQYIATLNYKGALPENARWIITVQHVRSAEAVVGPVVRPRAEYPTQATAPFSQSAAPFSLPAPTPEATPPRLDPAARARLVAAFRDAVTPVLAQAGAGGVFNEPFTLAEVKESSAAASSAIDGLHDQALELRKKLAGEDRADDIWVALNTVDALVSWRNATRDLKAADAPAASTDVSSFHVSTPAAETDEQKPLWKCLNAIWLLCDRLQSQAKAHLDRAKAAAGSGQNGTAISEYQEACKIYPDPEVSRTIKRLREESLGL